MYRNLLHIDTRWYTWEGVNFTYLHIAFLFFVLFVVVCFFIGFYLFIYL